MEGIGVKNGHFFQKMDAFLSKKHNIEPPVIENTAESVDNEISGTQGEYKEDILSLETSQRRFTETVSLINIDNGDRNTLVIKRPTLKDKGAYTCQATNESGTAARSFEINIEGNADWVMPSFQEQVESPFRISDDGDVTMEVEVAENPDPEIEWTRDDQSIQESDRIQLLKKEDNVFSLVIKGAQPEDEGKYTCTATNPAGKTMRTYTLNIGGVKTKPLETLEKAIAPPKVL